MTSTFCNVSFEERQTGKKLLRLCPYLDERLRFTFPGESHLKKLKISLIRGHRWLQTLNFKNVNILLKIQVAKYIKSNRKLAVTKEVRKSKRGPKVRVGFDLLRGQSLSSYLIFPEPRNWFQSSIAFSITFDFCTTHDLPSFQSTTGPGKYSG